MATKLKNLKVMEISLVDRPANPGATALLFKRLETDSVTVTLDELMGAVTKALDEKLSGLQKSLDDRLGPLEQAMKGMGAGYGGDDKEMEDKGGKKKKEAEAKKPADDAKAKKSEDGNLEKADIEDMIAKAVEDVAKAKDAEIAKLSETVTQLQKGIEKRDEKLEMAEYVQKAQALLPNLEGTAEQKAQMLLSIDKMADESQRKYFMDILTAKNNVNEKLFSEVGSSALVSKQTVEDELDKLAKAYQEKDSKLSYHEAYDLALKSEKGKALYKQDYDERLNKRAGQLH